MDAGSHPHQSSEGGPWAGEFRTSTPTAHWLSELQQTGRVVPFASDGVRELNGPLWALMAFLAVMTVAAYGSVWNSPWLYDDWNWLPFTTLTSSDWRAWGRLPFAWANALSGGLPWASHGLILAVHLLNGVLLVSLLRKWFSEPALALVLALFWLHPLQVEAVGYVTGGIEVLLTLYVLVALKGLQTETWLGYAVALCGFSLALALKWSALPLLLVVPILLSGINPMIAVRFAALVIPAASVLLWSAFMAWGPWHHAAGTMTRWVELQQLAVGLWRGLSLVVVPYGFSIEHDWAIVPAAFALMAVLASVIAGVLAYRLQTVWEGPWWAYVWIVGLLLPRALVLHEASPLTEHHLYLPFLALWCLAGAALDRFTSTGELKDALYG